MSQALAQAIKDAPVKKRTRKQILALIPPLVYDDGRTKQSFRDECDINLIMQRAAKGGTISHITKYEGVYADFSDYDFFEQTQKLTQGREIFDALDAEVRREFGQSPQRFFDYVNDPANKDDLLMKLPALAAPGTQLPQVVAPGADEVAAQEKKAAPAAASERASEPAPVIDPGMPEIQKTPAGEAK